MDIITIDGVALPHPSTLQILKSDLDSPDTTRNELGMLQRDRIRQGVYKIELEFRNKTGSEIATIESVIQGAKLTVKFPDTNGLITKEMYVGDRTKEVVLYNNGVVSETRWTLNFNLVEY